MEKEQPQQDFPKWFMMTTKIARHCVYGIILLFFLLQLDWTRAHVDEHVLGWINIVLVIIAVPTFIFSGADIIQIFIKILTVLKNNDAK